MQQETRNVKTLLKFICIFSVTVQLYSSCFVLSQCVFHRVILNSVLISEDSCLLRSFAVSSGDLNSDADGCILYKSFAIIKAQIL